MILWPFKLAVSAVLWFFHTIFTSIGMDPSSGFTWVLCIICLTIVMRAVTIPLFMRQIKSMRGMNAMQGDLAKLQAKYKGKKDQLSRQAMAQEQMALFAVPIYLIRFKRSVLSPQRSRKPATN